ncbi:hypothetical protein HHI36_001697 [Cryptolaemus montrouzieri]|uniref:Reverse transcriptase domain-containing protein n=1 Tax=Cryptolaemus montrouzieri TaxID=559131 RepID=A0ABD2P8J9_9CUCU
MQREQSGAQHVVRKSKSAISKGIPRTPNLYIARLGPLTETTSITSLKKRGGGVLIAVHQTLVSSEILVDDIGYNVEQSFVIVTISNSMDILVRSIKVRIQGHLSDTYAIQNGVAQGGVMSVTFFLLAINDLEKLIKNPVKCIKFADDVTLLLARKNLRHNQTDPSKHAK